MTASSMVPISSYADVRPFEGRVVNRFGLLP